MDRPEIMAWRRAKRAELIAARMAMPPNAYKTACSAIGRQLDAILSARTPTLIGAYWPFRREYNVVAMFDRLIAQGHGIALPVVLGKNQPLEFRAWTRDTPMASGVYDIPYPAAGAPVHPSILIVPVVGFDAGRYRLGYGGGFYDRTLEISDPKPLCIGVGFEIGRLPTIHPLPHDIAMDSILTEKTFARDGS
jgi:5-formyltetrahydrofolate cyclo-ligase